MEKRRKLGKNKSKVWLLQAQYDIEAAIFSTANGYNEWSTFQAGQAAEKALKALIVATGRTAPKIHKLSALIGVVKKFVPGLRNKYIPASTLQAFTFISRYPFLLPGEYDAPHNYITAEQAQQCIEEAKTVVKIAQELSKD